FLRSVVMLHVAFAPLTPRKGGEGELILVVRIVTPHRFAAAAAWRGRRCAHARRRSPIRLPAGRGRSSCRARSRARAGAASGSAGRAPPRFFERLPYTAWPAATPAGSPICAWR